MNAHSVRSDRGHNSSTSFACGIKAIYPLADCVWLPCERRQTVRCKYKGCHPAATYNSTSALLVRSLRLSRTARHRSGLKQSSYLQRRGQLVRQELRMSRQWASVTFQIRSWFAGPDQLVYAPLETEQATLGITHIEHIKTRSKRSRELTYMDRVDSDIDRDQTTRTTDCTSLVFLQLLAGQRKLPPVGQKPLMTDAVTASRHSVTYAIGLISQCI